MNIPSDTDTLDASFNKDVDDAKYVPTTEFLKYAYDKCNDEFFNGELPSGLVMEVKSKPTKSWLGEACYRLNRWEGSLVPTRILLNSSKTLTIHEWFEVVLHEMVHVVDYVMNPHHFTKMRHYDSHGDWFLDYGKRFEKDGFHVQKYCKADIGINVDDKRIAKRLSEDVFILMQGGRMDNGIVKVSPSMKDKTLDILSRKCDGMLILKSTNPNTAQLKQLRLRDKYSSVRYYIFDDDFQKRYGPFKEIGSTETWKLVGEDKDEMEFDDANHIDDDYAKRIYDNITGVIDVKRVKKDEYEVSIS